jgi:hypothetical protein
MVLDRALSLAPKVFTLDHGDVPATETACLSPADHIIPVTAIFEDVAEKDRTRHIASLTMEERGYWHREPRLSSRPATSHFCMISTGLD